MPREIGNRLATFPALQETAIYAFGLCVEPLLRASQQGCATYPEDVGEDYLSIKAWGSTSIALAYLCHGGEPRL